MAVSESLLRRAGILLALCATAACARPGGQAPDPTAKPDSLDAEEEMSEPDSLPDRVATTKNNPSVEPRLATLVGLMPVANLGIDRFREQNPTYDGRGVLIGILDSGLDAGLPGFQETSSGERKVLDLRDFSGEGRLVLQRIEPVGGVIRLAGREMAGFGHIAAMAAPPYYGGEFQEIRLGNPDVNGNGRLDDVFAMIVIRTTSGWAVVTDTDADGLLNDETPVHDYLVAGETFTLSHREGRQNRGPMTIAVNATQENGEPVIDLFFDNDSHGSHVAGIAAGHNMFGQEGFDGMAPGAQLITMKIANNARGGVTVNGSMLRAMNYAANFAQQRGLPLVLNMSFGVGNDSEGGAAIDSIIDEFALKHPDVLFVLSAGNDGPGISTIGFPGSAENAMTVCALFPGIFSGPRPAGFATDSDGIAEFSARGGELGKPDVCAPGVAFSNVPLWNTGGEISGGTSQAAPQITGAAALLQSVMVQNERVARGVDLKRAMIVSAVAARGGTTLDMGSGVPNITRAMTWLSAGHQAGIYSIRSHPDGGNQSRQDAAYRRNGLAAAADTLQRFTIRSVGGQPSASFLLRSDQRWLKTPATVDMDGGPADVTLTYDADQLRTPGLYVGSVWATPANDTLAGPAFRLTNTIVVSHPLEQPFIEGRDLGPGRLRRYFFRIDENSGGFTVEMELRYETQRGTLFLFEPNGQAFRGAAQEAAGGPNDKKARIVVRAEDVVPGVYEAVVSAPPESALSYELRAALPRYTVDAVGPAEEVVVTMRKSAVAFIQDASVFQREGEFNTASDSVAIVAEVIGAAMTRMVRGRDGAPQAFDISVPLWARELEVEVQLPDGAWNLVTDFAVTLFDQDGAIAANAPLSYGFWRTIIELERYQRGRPLKVELFPAFAHLEPPPEWSAEVRLTFIARNPIALEATSMDTSEVFTLAPGEAAAIRFKDVPDDWVVPTGYAPVLEVSTNPAGGAPARRRSRIGRP